jgi:hypothetical protein
VYKRTGTNALQACFDANLMTMNGSAIPQTEIRICHKALCEIKMSRDSVLDFKCKNVRFVLIVLFDVFFKNPG